MALYVVHGNSQCSVLFNTFYLLLLLLLLLLCVCVCVCVTLAAFSDRKTGIKRILGLAEVM